MNTSTDLSGFKKSSLLFFISMASNTIAVFSITVWLVTYHGWQETGTLRAVLIGFSIACIFSIYSILCFKAFKNPSVKNISIIYGVQSIFFAIFSVLIWFTIFTPAY